MFKMLSTKIDHKASRLMASSLMVMTLTAGAVMMAIPQESKADQTTFNTIVGTVKNVEILTSTYIRKTPVEEKVCSVDEVPIYEESKGGDELGGLIIGGLLGSAVGNQISGADGAGTVGAVTGALIGREHAKNKKTTGKIVGYRQEETCRIEKRVREERIEEVTGYRLTVNVDGEIVTLKSASSYDSGDDIKIRRKTTYSLD